MKDGDTILELRTALEVALIFLLIMMITPTYHVLVLKMVEIMNVSMVVKCAGGERL